MAGTALPGGGVAGGVPGDSALGGWDLVDDPTKIQLCSLAERLRLAPSSPDTVITKLLPSMITSEPETPMPLSRFSMIVRASFRLSALGGAPLGKRAVRVTPLPPCRSIPSLG